MITNLSLFFRQEGQGTSEELRSRDFRRDLDDREKNVREKRDRNRGEFLLISLKFFSQMVITFYGVEI